MNTFNKLGTVYWYPLLGQKRDANSPTWFSSHLDLYPMPPAPSVLKLPIRYDRVAQLPISLFIPVLRRERNSPKACPDSALVYISGVPATYPIGLKDMLHFEWRIAIPPGYAYLPFLRRFRRGLQMLRASYCCYGAGSHIRDWFPRFLVPTKASLKVVRGARLPFSAPTLHTTSLL